MEFRFYLRTIQRGWWLILISILVAVSVSLIYSYYFVTPMYESQAKFVVSPNLSNFERESDLVDSLETLDKRSIVATYGEIISSRQVFVKSIVELGANPLDYVDYTTSVTVLPDTNILQLTVQGLHPEAVTVLANSIGQKAINQIKSLYQVYDINFLDVAIPPLEPFRPQPLQDAGLALLLGAVVGVGLAILRDQLSSSLDRLSRRRMVDSESLAFTRNEFDRRLRDEIATHPDSYLSLGFIYLNGIESISDSLPQSYLNQIVRKVTSTLQYHLRGNDIVGRWSKLQFSVMMPTTPGQSATQKLDQIRGILSQPFSLDSSGDIIVNLDPRIGVAARKKGETSILLVENTNRALEIALQSENKTNLYTSD
jgi:diguanylate cyclase (GGDEF)-like protein